MEKQVQNLNLNFGPQHPAAHGVLRLVLELDGEVSFITNNVFLSKSFIFISFIHQISLKV